MTSPEHSDAETGAVSPVVAVILLVGITVILSATVGLFALDLGDSATSGGQSNLGAQITASESDGTVTARIVTGSAEEVRLLVNGAVEDQISDASAGDTLSATAQSSDQVSLVAVENGQETVVTSTTPISESSAGPTAPTEGLIAHYEFDEGSGDTLADSAGGVDATRNGPSWVTDSPLVGDASLLFDGSSDTASTSGTNAHAFDTSSATFTVSAWVSHNSVTGGQSYMARYDSSNSEKEWLFSNEDGEVRFSGYEGGGSTTRLDVRSTSTPLTTTDAHHVVAVVDIGNNAVTIYVDGDEQPTEHVGDGGITDMDSTGTQTRFGHIKGTDGNILQHYDGVLDDVRLYDRKLSESEVQDLYDATK